jgi:hypothetical protein
VDAAAPPRAGQLRRQSFFYVVLPAFLAAKLLVLDQPISMPA